MNCLLCNNKLDSIYYTNIKEYGVICSSCDLRIGPYETEEEVLEAIKRLFIALER